MENISKIAEILFKPAKPSEGPPLPASWDLYWPGFMKRGIKRIIEEPPWVTLTKEGNFIENLKAELRREFEVVTGRKL